MKYATAMKKQNKTGKEGNTVNYETEEKTKNKKWKEQTQLSFLLPNGTNLLIVRYLLLLVYPKESLLSKGFLKYIIHMCTCK